MSRAVSRTEEALGAHNSFLTLLTMPAALRMGEERPAPPFNAMLVVMVEEGAGAMAREREGVATKAVHDAVDARATHTARAEERAIFERKYFGETVEVVTCNVVGRNCEFEAIMWVAGIHFDPAKGQHTTNFPNAFTFFPILGLKPKI